MRPSPGRKRTTRRSTPEANSNVLPSARHKTHRRSRTRVAPRRVKKLVPVSPRARKSESQRNGEVPMRIAFVGAYGNGKTTLTTELSARLGLERTHGSAMRDPAGGARKALEETTDPELIQLAVRRFMER